jgi:3-oxoacyl-[acyl-carrier-protein] synthase II
MERRRVVVTGIGVTVPGGIGTGQLWNHIHEGVSAAGIVDDFREEHLPVHIGAEVKDFDPAEFIDRKSISRTERCTQFALASAELAYHDAGCTVDCTTSKRTGVFDGTSLGSINSNLSQQRAMLEAPSARVSPSALLKGMTGSSSGDVALHFHTHGPAVTFSMGSVSSSYAIGYAFRKIKMNELDVAFAGGAEAPLSKEIISLFSTAHLLSTDNDCPATACKPFDVHRNGFVMGEGGAMMILEELQQALKRGAHIYAEIAGFGESTDAYHQTTPDPEGSMIVDAMEAAMKEANIRPYEVQYINAHGTATQFNDAAEAKAIQRVFSESGRSPAVSSTKPITGHLLGACGAVEFAITSLAIFHQWIPPTMNLKEPEPAFDLDCVPQHGRSCEINVAISNNYSFGGRNSSLVIKRWIQ